MVIEEQTEEKRETFSNSSGSGSAVTNCLFRFWSGKRLYPTGFSDANSDAKMLEASWSRRKVMELRI